MQCFLNDEWGKITQKTRVRLRVNTPENKIEKQNGLDSPEFEPFRFFSKKFEKRLDKSIRSDIIKAISNSRKECERRNIYLKVE